MFIPGNASPGRPSPTSPLPGLLETLTPSLRRPRRRLKRVHLDPLTCADALPFVLASQFGEHLLTLREMGFDDLEANQEALLKVEGHPNPVEAAMGYLIG